MPRGLPGFARRGQFGHAAAMDKPRMRKLILIAAVVFAALLLPLGLLVFGVRGMWKERAEQRASQAQFSEALRLSLERAADVVLPVPTLGQGAMVVALPLEKIEHELQRVVRLAAGLGERPPLGMTAKRCGWWPMSQPVPRSFFVNRSNAGFTTSMPPGSPAPWSWSRCCSSRLLRSKRRLKTEVAVRRLQGFRFPVTP